MVYKMLRNIGIDVTLLCNRQYDSNCLSFCTFCISYTFMFNIFFFSNAHMVIFVVKRDYLAKWICKKIMCRNYCGQLKLNRRIFSVKVGSTKVFSLFNNLSQLVV